MNSKTKKGKKTIVFMIQVLAVMVIGFIGGFWGIPAIKSSLNIANNSMAGFFVTISVFIIIVALGMLINIIIHELGHLIFGKLSGYDFVSFRIFSKIYLKKDGKIRSKKYKLKGTSGQCLMSPPPNVRDDYPYMLYNLGGSLANLIFSNICIFMYLFTISSIPFVAVTSIFFAIIGLYLGAVNILPLKLNGIPTDGYNIVALGKSKQVRYAFWVTLKANAVVASGGRFRDIPFEWVEKSDNDDLDSTVGCTIALTRFNYFFDKHFFAKAQRVGNYVLENSTKLLELYKNELLCDMLFIEIIGQHNEERIFELYSDELQRYININSSNMSKQRLIYAIEKLVHIDDKAAKKALAMFNKAILKYPNNGEIEAEKELINLVDNAVR